MTATDRTDVLVVGGGPAGAATSYWLAKAGHRVTCVERKTFPRDKTCGDGLTPRAVKQLADMGLYDELVPYHRYTGLRAVAHGVTVELNWPDHPVYPDHGFVVKRRQLDQIVFEHAASAGADCHQGTEAVSPIVESGLVAGAVVKDKATGETRDIRARYDEIFATCDRSPYGFVHEPDRRGFAEAQAPFKAPPPPPPPPRPRPPPPRWPKKNV